MKKLNVCLLSLLATSLISCTSKTELLSDFSIPSNKIILQDPKKDTASDEHLIVKLNYYIENIAKTNKEKAEGFYELGIVYDRLGLLTSARNMFLNSLSLLPNFAPSYNFLGIYLTLEGRFIEANEALDAAIELNPKGSYAYLNRGISLYYAKRYGISILDLEKFYSFNKNDPYRMIWLYIVEREFKGEEYAFSKLQARYANADKNSKEWGFDIVLHYLNLESEDEIFKKLYDKELSLSVRQERLCETYYYLAKLNELNGKDKIAYDYYNLVFSTNKTDFLEYRYASLDLNNLKKKHNILKSSLTKNDNEKS